MYEGSNLPKSKINKETNKLFKKIKNLGINEFVKCDIN